MVNNVDHTLHFHAECSQPLSWVLVELESPWAADSRALIRMRFWSPAGELLATAVQEMLIRTVHKSASSPTAKL